MSPSLPVILAAGEPSYTPSQYMPSFLVEIAFTATFATPAASRVWTDVSSYVEFHQGIDIGFGRQNENSTADANDLTLTLDNSDGRFTALRSASPYYPNVKVGRPIRVSATTVTGFTSVRFVGFVDEWPVEWDGTDAYAKATIRATSRMSRLGLMAKMRSMPEGAVLTGDPAYYWTMGDSASATAAAQSGPSGGPLLHRHNLRSDSITSPVVFGNATGPPVDGMTAAEFAGGQIGGAGVVSQYLRATGLSVPSGPITIRASVKLNSLPTPFDGTVISFDDGVSAPIIRVTSAGLVGGTVTTGPSVNDGATHDVAVVFNGTDQILYLDGVAVHSAAASTPSASTILSVGYGFPGVIAHVAIYTRALTAVEVAAQAQTVLTGSTGDTTDERLLRILEWAGVASTEVDAEAGDETMTYQLTSGMSVVDALREVESTEGGVLFDGADGNVKFHNRSHRYLATPAVTLNMASQHVGSDYAPRLDRSTLVNDVTVDNPTTEESARQVDTASSDEYGIATSSATSVADSYAALQEKASWLIASYAEPRMRCPSLTVDVLAHQGLTPSTETLLAITVGSLLAVTNAPTQSDTTSPSYFVEGYTETIGPESYAITFNLSPARPTLDTFVLDSATRGLLDTGILAY